MELANSIMLYGYFLSFFGMFNYYSHSFIFDIMLTQQSPGLDSGVAKHVFWSFMIFVRSLFYTNVIIMDNFTTHVSLIINTCLVELEIKEAYR
jgi:hypothetical protein